VFGEVLLFSIGSPVNWQIRRTQKENRPAGNSVELAIDWALAAYWVAITLKNTVFSSWPFYEGMYAPIYPFLVLGALKGLASRRNWPIFPVLAYYLLMLLALFALLANQVPLTMSIARRLVAYGFGAVALLNLLRPKAFRALIAAQVVTGIVISSWVIHTSMTTRSAYRGGIDVNWNYVSLVISFGIIPVVVYLYHRLAGSKRINMLAAVLALVVQTYAMLLLASRGTSIALLAGLLVLLARVAKRRRMTAVSLMTLLFAGVWVLYQLPGGNALRQRWFEDRTESLNLRVPIWQTVVDEYVDRSVAQMLFGSGFDSGEYLADAAVSGLGSLHNAYLQVLFEEGLVGLIAFLIIPVWCFLRTARGSGRDHLYVLMVLAFVSIANLSGSDEHMFEFWIAFGAAGAISFQSASTRPVGSRLQAILRLRRLDAVQAPARP
jgi:O-antigen ligase